MSARAAVVTVSSSLARGEGEDVSGPALVRLCEAAGLEVQHEVVSDDRESILAALKRLADHDGVRFIFTTGGTGLTVDDVTPEATRAAIGVLLVAHVDHPGVPGLVEVCELVRQADGSAAPPR